MMICGLDKPQALVGIQAFTSSVLCKHKNKELYLNSSQYEVKHLVLNDVSSQGIFRRFRYFSRKCYLIMKGRVAFSVQQIFFTIIRNRLFLPSDHRKSLIFLKFVLCSVCWSTTLGKHCSTHCSRVFLHFYILCNHQRIH